MCLIENNFTFLKKSNISENNFSREELKSVSDYVVV